MRRKSEEETKSFILHKEIAMMIIMLMPLILYQCNLLTPFHFVALSVIFIFDIFWNSGENCLQPAITTRRKKTRKPGNCISRFFAMKKLKHLLNLNGTCNEIQGHTIDKLFISTKEIAKGGNGTVVFEGFYEGRKVAVKRLSKTRNKAALKEVQNLTESDQHPNIVRLHSVKYDKDYVYLVLERCVCSLSDLVSLFAGNSDEFGHQVINKPWKTRKQDIYLWKSNGYPSALLLKLMRDMVEGLVHLHELGIIHQDIKPQNVMLAKGMDICAKLSEIGISKCLPSDKSSLSQNSTGSGSSRWGPLEKKLHKRRRWTSDMFSLGCVFYFCLSRGGHPFDHHLEDDINNGNNRMSLHLVNHIPEATDLLSRLLDPNPKMRPKANQVLHHPLFWDSDMRLSFLRDVSDRIELERHNSNILINLTIVAQRAFGARWDKQMEPELVKDICRSRPYNYRSLRHLLRVVRNKLNHYYQSPKNIQELLCSVPKGFDDYFSCRFPRLLMEVYEVVIRHCRSEKCFEKYFRVDSVSVVCVLYALSCSMCRFSVKLLVSDHFSSFLEYTSVCIVR